MPRTFAVPEGLPDHPAGYCWIDMVRYRKIRRRDLDAVLALCETEGWRGYTEDRRKSWRSFTAPGVITLVADVDGETAGFIQLHTDGHIQAHLSLLAVGRTHRRQGLARGLIREAFRLSGARRIDLACAEGAEDFYRTYHHNEGAGFRIYPDLSVRPEVR